MLRAWTARSASATPSAKSSHLRRPGRCSLPLAFHLWWSRSSLGSRRVALFPLLVVVARRGDPLPGRRRQPRPRRPGRAPRRFDGRSVRRGDAVHPAAARRRHPRWHRDRASASLLLIIPGLILLTIWAVFAPAIVIERIRVIDAFGRSRELVRGNGWPVFGVIIVAFLIAGDRQADPQRDRRAIADGVVLRIIFSLPASRSRRRSPRSRRGPRATAARRPTCRRPGEPRAAPRHGAAAARSGRQQRQRPQGRARPRRRSRGTARSRAGGRAGGRSAPAPRRAILCSPRRRRGDDHHVAVGAGADRQLQRAAARLSCRPCRRGRGRRRCRPARRSGRRGRPRPAPRRVLLADLPPVVQRVRRNFGRFAGAEQVLLLADQEADLARRSRGSARSGSGASA